MHSGVPQGSVLDPIRFTMYINPLSAIIDSHPIIHHSFADDLQLQMSAPPDLIYELLYSMQWMEFNRNWNYKLQGFKII